MAETWLHQRTFPAHQVKSLQPRLKIRNSDESLSPPPRRCSSTAPFSPSGPFRVTNYREFTFFSLNPTHAFPGRKTNCEPLIIFRFTSCLVSNFKLFNFNLRSLWAEISSIYDEWRCASDAKGGIGKRRKEDPEKYRFTSTLCSTLLVQGVLFMVFRLIPLGGNFFFSTLLSAAKVERLTVEGITMKSHFLRPFLACFQKGISLLLLTFYPQF